MSIFGNIMNKIFHHGAPKAQAPGTSQPTPQPSAQDQSGGVATAPAPAQTAPAQNVDVGAVLSEMAAAKGGGGNYQTSIVDLLKLLDLDSSLEARKELAADLGVNAGPQGSAEQNIALSKAVWVALEKNGGKVPAALKD